MSVLVCTLQGRFGNQCLQWAFAFAFAQQKGMRFQCEPWIGERIFLLPDYERPFPGASYPRMNEVDIFQPALDISQPYWSDREFRGYAQSQRAMIYTKRQAQSWLKLRPEIETACANAVLADGGKDDRIVCHRRLGDYAGYGYPVVSLRSYERACERFGLKWNMPQVSILSEEDPTPHAGFLPDDLAFMPDFYRMMVAPTLLRGNSSFSWLAALLGDGLVLSPIVEGLEGGKEHDCAFVAGNWPRFTNLDFVTDLHVSP